MPSKPNVNVTLPLLDRLLYDDPKHKKTAPMTPAQTEAALKASVRRDLEWLLNTRRIVAHDLPPNVANSVYCYGLPDYSSLADNHEDAFAALARLIENAIATYEPRLSVVKVLFVRPKDNTSRRVELVIEAMLHREPSPEPVSYNTVLDLANGEYTVKGEAGGG